MPARERARPSVQKARQGRLHPGSAAWRRLRQVAHQAAPAAQRWPSTGGLTCDQAPAQAMALLPTWLPAAGAAARASARPAA